MGEESGRSGHRWYQPDLNIDRDRPYLIGRGFAFAVIAEGDRRGKVVSAHRTRALAELAAKAFGGKKPPKSSKSRPSLKRRCRRSIRVQSFLANGPPEPFG